MLGPCLYYGRTVGSGQWNHVFSAPHSSNNADTDVNLGTTQTYRANIVSEG